MTLSETSNGMVFDRIMREYLRLAAIDIEEGDAAHARALPYVAGLPAPEALVLLVGMRLIERAIVVGAAGRYPTHEYPA